MKVTIAHAKARFEELIRRAESGEVIEITRYGCAVARLTGVGCAGESLLIGALKGKMKVPDDILKPISEKELESWEGSGGKINGI